jgi:phosphopantothenate synthetase
MLIDPKIELNPLSQLLEVADIAGGIPINDTTLKLVKDIFSYTSIKPENHEEVLKVLELFSEFYNITEIVKVGGIFYFRKVNGS